MRSFVRKALCFSGLLLAATLSSNASESKKGEDYPAMTEDGAQCWFQDPRAVYVEGKHKRTYSGWVTKKGALEVGYYDHDTKETKKVVIRPNWHHDDHNNNSFAVLPDKRIMIYYARHNRDGLYCRTSKFPEDITQWEDEVVVRAKPKKGRGTSYNHGFYLENEKKHYVFWRGGNWKPTFATSVDGKNWSKPSKLIEEPGKEGRGVRPYIKYVSDGKGSIHMVFTDGHPRNEPTNSVYYLKYEGGKFYKADGTQVGSMDALPVRHSASDVVYNAKETKVRSWIWDIAIDATGEPVILYTRLPETTDHRLYYAKWNGSKWIDHEIAKGGKWFPQTLEGKKEREKHYSGGMCLNQSNPSIVYLSRQVDGGNFEIERRETSDNGKTWSVQPITRNSADINVRPIFPRGYTGKDDHILWMNGKYIHYVNYDTGIRMLLPGDSTPVSNDKAQLEKPSADAVFNLTKKVADWQINTFENQQDFRAISTRKQKQIHNAQTNPNAPNKDKWALAYARKWHDLKWHNGALYAGMDHWRSIAGSDKYTQWLKSIGARNNWKLYNRPYHADDHTVGQFYLSLYDTFKDSAMLEPTKKGFDYILANPKTGSLKWSGYGKNRHKTDCHYRWGWCDALFMAPPVWARLAKITGEKKYLDFLYQEYKATYDILWSEKDQLFFRDTSFLNRREKNGKNIFWSRGNGWVFGGLALMIPDMPKDWEHRPFFIDIYKRMAASLLKIQREDGTWSMGLLGGVEGYPIKETSGSSFFTFGLAWGLNNGILDKATYEPAVYKAWNALNDCVTPDGLLGHVQPVGAAPGDSFADKSEVYGVGAFLAAGTEVYKLVK